MTAPLCFVEPWVYELWAGSRVPNDRTGCPSGPCTDCTPTYQLRMKKRGLCEHPETMFTVGQDGGVFGVWPTVVAA